MLVTVPSGQVVKLQKALVKFVTMRSAPVKFVHIRYAWVRFALYRDAPLRAELFARSSYLPLMFGCTFHR